MSSEMKIAYLFTSSRDELIDRARRGNDADTPLWGMNHIDGAQAFVAAPGSLKQFLLIPLLLEYDVIIAQDNFLLGYIVSLYARIFHLKTRWIFLNMTASTLIRRHASHTLRLLLLKMFWKSYARIVCLSSKQMEDLVSFGIRRDRVVFIPFGVDTTFFNSAVGTLSEDTIVSGGRDAGRDYKTLFEAATHVGHPFTVFVGQKSIHSDTVIPQNVSVRFNMNLVDVRDELYRHAIMVVIVSKDEWVTEGSDCSGQTVILDAMASGKAVITTNRQWIHDYFVSGEDLQVVEPNDPGALSQAINSLLADDSLRKKLAESGHLKVINKYTTKKFAKELLALAKSTK